MRKCKDEENIDLYLKGGLSEAESAAFEEHYFNCPACFRKMGERAEIVDVIRSRGASIFAPEAQQGPEPRVSLWGRAAAALTARRWITAAVGAAALLIVVLGVVPRFRSRAPQFVLSGNETVRGESLVLFAPLGRLTAAPGEFAWKPVPAASEYRVTLSSGTEVIWTTTILETKATLPADIRAALRAGVSYSWQVKAYSAQGTMIAASPREAFEFSY